ncbi:hypothetical protein K470DRAFT_292056 [Piedraia hortae CBS 480.64]|uniref:Uncharacterized protein n=1 Tax=Piedraia hortae CBS 480.64 TaxID=1314780 RepID=A0A6A7CAW3_9PEZI|nr:hypothetical protein K470DRAFT_292056 [Piedraia hortae CBS 480.64]
MELGTARHPDTAESPYQDPAATAPLWDFPPLYPPSTTPVAHAAFSAACASLASKFPGTHPSEACLPSDLRAVTPYSLTLFLALTNAAKFFNDQDTFHTSLRLHRIRRLSEECIPQHLDQLVTIQVPSSFEHRHIVGEYVTENLRGCILRDALRARKKQMLLENYEEEGGKDGTSDAEVGMKMTKVGGRLREPVKVDGRVKIRTAVAEKKAGESLRETLRKVDAGVKKPLVEKRRMRKEIWKVGVLMEGIGLENPATTDVGGEGLSDQGGKGKRKARLPFEMMDWGLMDTLRGE